MKSVAVIGASLAGLYAARALRAQGFDGRLVIVGAEHHRPYDRPPLSKGFLTGATTDQGQLALADAEEIAELDAEWLLGTRATGLDTRGRAVLLDGGRSLTTDGVVIATGLEARATSPARHPPEHTPCAPLRTPRHCARNWSGARSGSW